MTKKRIARSILSFFLSLVLIISGFLPGIPLVSTVHAETATNTITPGTDEAKTGTGTMEISLTIKKTPAAGDFTFTPPTSLMYDGQPKEATVTTEAEDMGAVTVEYYNGSTKLDSAPTAEGTYTVKVNVEEGDEYKAATGITDDSWTFTIAPMQQTMTITLVIKGEPTVTAPTAKSLTYTGSAQELVNAGTVTGGTMYYAVTTENTAPTDESLYTTSIPTGTTAGTYYVWYKVVGDSNHNDKAPASVTITIAKKAATISFDASSVSKKYGDSKFTNALTNTGDGTVGYSSSNTDVATVDDNGEVTIAGSGNTTITATAADGDNYTYAVKSITYALGVDTAAMDVSAEGYTGQYDGKAHTITVTVTSPDGATVKYGTKEGTYDLTEAPTYTNVGSYTIYYQVTKTNYTTVTNSAAVVITRVDNYKLKGMIENAEESYADLAEMIDNSYYATIKDRLMSIANTLKTAIDAAKAVADNENVTEAQIDAATETLKDADKKADDELYDLLITDVEEKIAAIGNISYDNLSSAGARIAEARDHYDNSLTASQQKEVSNYQTLVAAEAKYAEMKVNKDAADAVIAKISNASDKASVQAARAAYDALTAEQKSLIPAETLKKLTDAEAALKAAEAAAEAAAAQVSNHVSTGTLSAAQVQAISAAGYKSITIDSGVRKIDTKAFAGTNIKTVVIKSKKLSKKRVKNAFKGSKVTKVRVKVSRKKSVNNKYLKKYKKIFTKKNCGKKVTVKK